MARYINAENLKKSIEKINIKITDQQEFTNGINEIIKYCVNKIIDAEPAGYDLDEVLEQMEEIEPCDWTDTIVEVTEHNMWEMCFEIVKAGGKE